MKSSNEKETKQVFFTCSCCRKKFVPNSWCQDLCNECAEEVTELIIQSHSNERRRHFSFYLD